MKVYVRELSTQFTKAHGTWIDLDLIDSAGEFNAHVSDWLQELMDAAGPDVLYEEWQIVDFEDIPSAYVSDWGIDSEFWEFKQVVNSIGLEAATAAADWGLPMSTAAESYAGEYESEEDYARYHVEEFHLLSEMSDALRVYFDYESYARDLFICDMTFADGHVFYNA